MTRARWLLFVLLVWCTACAASLHFDIARPQPAAPSSVAYVAASASPPAPAPSAAPASHHRLGMNVPIPAPTATAGVALVSRGAGLNPAWSALNLAASGAVTGTLPSANLPNLAGDVTGAPGSNVVSNLSGSAGTVTASATTLNFDAASTVGIGGTGAANGTAASLTLSGQAPNATNGTPGGVTIDLGAPTGSGGKAYFGVSQASTQIVALGQLGSSQGAIYLGAVAPSSTNYALYSDGVNATVINGNGGLNININGSATVGAITTSGWQLFSGATSFGGGTGVLGIANATTAPTSWPGSSTGLVLYSTSGALGVDAGGLVFPSFIANPTIQPLAPTTDAATSDLTIVGQGAYASAVTNVNGGNVILGGGPAASGGTPGSIKFNLGSTTYAYFGGWSSNPGFYPETGGTGYLGSATNEWHSVHSDYAFVTTEAIPQTDLGAALGLSGNRWSELDVQGVSITSAGLGGNASAATPAAAALTWQTTSLALSSGTVTLTAAQASTPLIALTGSTSAAETLVFPNTQAQWYIDTTGITSLGSGAVTIECGTGAKTMSLSGSYTVGLYEVYCNGANKLYMQWIAD